ncbi:MAG: hypothetical protein Q8P97_00470 [bacterium]|nr:hypothetical protein [bacterium]
MHHRLIKIMKVKTRAHKIVKKARVFFSENRKIILASAFILFVAAGALWSADFGFRDGVSLAVSDVSWTENAGAGVMVPACASMAIPPVVTACNGIIAEATISWTDPNSHGSSVNLDVCEGSWCPLIVYTPAGMFNPSGWDAFTLPAAGSVTLTPLKNSTTYVYALRDTSGTVIAYPTFNTLNCAPPPPPPIVTLTASPNPVDYNTASTLTWFSTYATSCTGSGGTFGGVRPPSGNLPTGNLTTDTSYTLTCTGPGGSGSDNVTINVNPPPPPTADIKADGSDGPITILPNTSATITWCGSPAAPCANADSCSVSPGGWTGISGTQSTGNLTASLTYTLTCNGPGGTRVDDVVVQVVGANQTPVASATISKDGVTYADLITVTRGVATPVYLSASGSTDPDGWTDATNGVSSGGKCEWNSDLNLGVPTFETTLNNPATPSACNISLGTKTFNDLPGTYTYSVLRITDRPGAVSGVDMVSVKVEAAPLPASGDVKIKRVDETLNIIGGTQAWVDSLSPLSANPADFMLLTTGSHTAVATDLAGFTESAGTCTYPRSGMECTVSSFTTTPSCNGSSCSVPASVSGDIVTKVVFRYTPGVPPIVTLKASPKLIQPGGSSLLTWTSDAVSCSATTPSGWTAKTTPNDTQSVSPPVTTNYVITCVSSSGVTAQAQATVTVGIIEETKP